jgi:hypothetical protein
MQPRIPVPHPPAASAAAATTTMPLTHSMVWADQVSTASFVANEMLAQANLGTDRHNTRSGSSKASNIAAKGGGRPTRVCGERTISCLRVTNGKSAAAACRSIAGRTMRASRQTSTACEDSEGGEDGHWQDVLRRAGRLRARIAVAHGGVAHLDDVRDLVDGPRAEEVGLMFPAQAMTANAASDRQNVTDGNQRGLRGGGDGGSPSFAAEEDVWEAVQPFQSGAGALRALRSLQLFVGKLRWYAYFNTFTRSVPLLEVVAMLASFFVSFCAGGGGV